MAAPRDHVRVGMYDAYEPQPPISCPICGAPSLGWQGKDGPCALFLWRQGSRHPVDQQIDEDVRIDPASYGEFVLPPTFKIIGWCANDHLFEATGRAPSGVWAETELT